ncbi:MAG TPA: GGDEF domain-containing protein [Phycisphaerae bacterium]|nr:GGDEF domain-containing protein [Phycisphaerae bacterium]
MTTPVTTSPPSQAPAPEPAPPAPLPLRELGVAEITEPLTDGPPPGPARARILVAGASAAAMRLAIPGVTVEECPTLIDAVLSAGDPRMVSVEIVAAAVSQEIEQLESATRALRKVYPAARIYLLCEPADEVRCRKGRAWGATDYLILPLDDADAAMLAAAAAPTRQPPARAIEAVRPPARQSGESPLSETIASAVQLPDFAALLQDLAAGHLDVPAQALALMQSHFAWNGTLRFVPADPGQTEILPPDAPGQLRAGVSSPDSAAIFGTLILDAPGDSQASADQQEALEEAAGFLSAVHAVARRFEQLRTLAITDELSGAYNRRYFSRFVSNLLDRAREQRFRVTVLLFDIDDFKHYNDRFGHAAGDAIIRELIKLLRACTRPHDLVARVGGDEFAVVFWDNEAPRQPNSEHPRDAVAAADRFRKAIQNHQWPATCHIQGQVSISGGLASFPWDADTLPDLLAKADEALLRAKAAGKNAILLHGAPCPDAGPDQT